jgi:hypothetical protein
MAELEAGRRPADMPTTMPAMVAPFLFAQLEASQFLPLSQVLCLCICRLSLLEIFLPGNQRQLEIKLFSSSPPASFDNYVRISFNNVK